MLAANTTAGKIVYGVLAGFVGVSYCVLVVFFTVKKGRAEKVSSEDIVMEERSS